MLAMTGHLPSTLSRPPHATIYMVNWCIEHRQLVENVNDCVENESVKRIIPLTTRASAIRKGEIFSELYVELTLRVHQQVFSLGT